MLTCPHVDVTSLCPCLDQTLAYNFTLLCNHNSMVGMRYTLAFSQPAADGSLRVTCPALPEVDTNGSSLPAGITRGRAAVFAALARRAAKADAFPPSDEPAASVAQIRVPMSVRTKLALIGAMASAGVTRAELTRRLGWGRNQVERLVDLHHATGLDQIDEALAALNLRLTLHVAPVAPTPGHDHA